MREEIELPDLDLGGAIGEACPTLDSSLLGNLGVVSNSMAVGSISSSSPGPSRTAADRGTSRGRGC